MKKIITLILICLGINALAQTTMENFNYGTSADTLTNPTKGGANWKRHSGTTPIVYNNTSLSYTGYNSSGIAGSAGFTNGLSEDANRPTISYNSGSVYASFLLSISSGGGTTGDYFFHFIDSAGLTVTSNFRARVFIKDGSLANTFKVGVNKGTTAATVASFSTADYPINTPILVVLKYKFDLTATLNDSVFAYIFTSGIPTTEPVTPTLIATDITAISDLIAIKAVAIRQGSTGTHAGTIDGIRVSNLWANGPLPVEFSGFKGTIQNNTVNLDWNTSSEINNKGFEVERSFNGNEFESIGFVKGAGNSNKLLSYQFNVENASFPITYYRLKQIDFDGKFDYSSIISISSDENKIEITPNPFVETVNIQALNQDQFVSAEIIDITGKVKASLSGKGNLTMDTKDLSQGIYFIRINNSEKVIVKRIIKN
jgi:hypothetical protein